MTVFVEAALLPPSAGSATIVGLDIIRHASRVRRVIGYVPQAASADGSLTGTDRSSGMPAVGVDPEGLREAVRAHNAFARTGIDEEFGKGANTYDRSTGDAEHGPNPCLGPIDRPPYYAVAVVPTPLGTSLGLLTNANAQVLDAEHAPIAGLYACGNDMQSPFGGEYPGAGSQLGLTMTFGYLAAKQAVGHGPRLRTSSVW